MTKLVIFLSIQSRHETLVLMSSCRLRNCGNDLVNMKLTHSCLVNYQLLACHKVSNLLMLFPTFYLTEYGNGHKHCINASLY